FHMIDVGPKQPTARRAEAQGRIVLSKEAFVALRDGKNPKGNVLALAETAGIMAAKKVSDLLPLCHPLPIDQVIVSFQLQPESFSVLVLCEVAVNAKTGVEMEALAGVNGALLCVYDLSKAVDPVLEIQDVRLNYKRGGKSGEWVHPSAKKAEVPATQAEAAQLAGAKVALITISDRVSRGEAEDKSGLRLQDLFKAAGATITEQQTIPDERAQIGALIRRLALETDAEMIISTGGTGLSPRDVTPEAVEDVCDRLIPGFGELLRSSGADFIKTAWLSRSVAGTIGKKLVIALPGSPNAVSEGLSVLMPLLKHSLHTLRGGDHHAIR
ncbi:MAG: bifunctional molybdenum cofactor biosynthesis protein MoaC/MoaB, partial [Proteobacteria bacterium]